MTASAQGYDVSNFQGQFDWQAAKAKNPQLAFGICKLTEGATFTDPDAAWNWQQLQALGLVRGGYHFGHPGESPQGQARFFAAEATRLGVTGRDILALDLEVSGGLPAANVASWARAFMAELEQHFPHNPLVVYTFLSFATAGNCAGLDKYPLWIAYPSATAPAAPPPWTEWAFWQWGVRGIDCDAFNGTTAALHGWLDSYQVVPAAGPWTADGATSLRQFAHGAGVGLLDVVVRTIQARRGQLGPGETMLLGGLLSGARSADDPVPAGVILWA